MRLMNLEDIKIPENFAASIPNEKKLKSCRKFWNEFHEQDRYIVINKENELIDGYIQYLILKENNVKDAEIQVSDRKRHCWKRKFQISKTENDEWRNAEYRHKMTAYVYGIHKNNKKQYVWRIPESKKEELKDILPCDKVVVFTNDGLRTITVTKIIWSDTPPIDMPINKVRCRCK